MTTPTYKILGQLDAAATTATTLYTVPGSTQTVVSYISVANRNSTSTTFRVWFAVNGAGDDNKQYIAYDIPIGPNESITLGHGTTLGAGDLIRVYAGATGVSFTAYGEENA